MDLGVSGLASGFDWRSLVDQLVDVERLPQRRLLDEQSLVRQRNNAYGSIKTQMGVLQNRVNTLVDSTLFDSRTSTVSDATVASATAAAGATQGTYTFQINQLATAAKRLGTSNVGAKLNTTSDVSALTLSNAGFSTAVTAGVITVNGKQVTIATSDTLATVFSNIASATGNAVTGSYDPNTDTISLAGTGEIVLGSATDTSNFLQVAKLSNNGSASVTSSAALGGVRTSVVLGSSNLATAVTDGGSGAGQFKINGVAISFNTSTDSLANVMSRINSSGAGVTASYDAINDRVVLANKSTGDVGVALEDVTGNFLSATGLLSGSLQRGKDLSFTVNGGGTITSRTNTITGDISGIEGLSVTALKEGSSVSITVASDTAKIKSAITDFITEYNKVQSVIDSHTASTTDAKGKVTAGILAGEADANDLSGSLRTKVNQLVSGITGSYKRLDDIGIKSNGNDNSIALSDADALAEALAENLQDVRTLFTDSTNGIATRLDSFLEDTIGEDGTLLAKQDRLETQSSDIDEQIATLERSITTSRQQLIDSFVAMEEAQSRSNQQLQFLQQRFG